MHPAGQNSTKPLCPAVNGTAVPAIRPVAVPQIVSLQGGQIQIGNISQPQPTQIKVPNSCPPLSLLNTAVVLPVQQASHAGCEVQDACMCR